ncbi:MAG: hypothetical protein JW864_13665 [Spirochaetes bacterium]|nr:hypothetical protein [Spirochaetota bacterium]
MNFIISIDIDAMSAAEYVFFQKENIIRKSIHSAMIDTGRDTLVIDETLSSGNDTTLTVDVLSDILSSLPQWNRTKYCRITGVGRDDMYLSSGNITVEHSKFPI